MTELAERWLPDAFIFALLATLLVALGGLTAGGATPRTVAEAWGNGFWTLIPFTLQMALIIITGSVVATAPPVRRLIDALAGLPRTGRQATVFVAAVAMITSWFNWGFGLVFAAVLARAVARRVRDVDYRTLAATTLMGLGSIWAQGLSSSASLLMATPSMLPRAIGEIVQKGGGPGVPEVPGGIIPLASTIFIWQSLVAVAVEIAAVIALLWFMTPTGDSVRTARDLGISLDDAAGADLPAPRTPGEWLEHQQWLSLLVVLLAGGYLVVAVWSAPSAAGAITPNSLNLCFLTLGFLLHRTPARLMRAFRDAVPSTWGLLLQYPFYAGIAAIITGTGLNAGIASFFTSIATPLSYPPLIAAYSALLGMFIPSGGSKWVVEAPYVLQAAHNLHVHLGWTVAVYNLGEAVANLIQPFWMLPVLGMLGLRARDIMGVTFTVFVFMLPLVLLLVTVLGATLGYPL